LGEKILEVQEIVKEIVSSETTEKLISDIVAEHYNSIIKTNTKSEKNGILFKSLTEKVVGLHVRDLADSGVSANK
jgi:hypothetical protein